MFTTKLFTAGLLCATSLLVAAPIASATTAPAGDTVAASDTAGLSSGSSRINLGCILQSLSGGPKTADCYPPSIPA
ncbi:hypothetical protein [Nocardia africana]|uniref:Secreted protein n=1 Tax=Nocardia africana TaxID=134964 RepID=A0ABW6NSG0_9NOCA